MTATEAAAAQRAVQAVTGTADVIPAAATPADADSAAVSRTSAGTVDVPKDPSDGLTLTTSSGVDISVGIPDAGPAQDARTDAAGTTVYVAPGADSTTTAVQVTSDGARELFTLEDASAPTDITVPLSLPPGAHLVPADDGGIDIVGSATDGVAVTLASVQAPWAKDAAGRNLPTTYTLNGDTLSQHVDTSGAVFPVVADPHYTWGWVTGTVYFNKSETATIGILGGASSFWAQFVPGWGTLLAGYGSTLAAVAGLARAHNRCLKVKLPVPVPGQYSGGYCS